MFWLLVAVLSALALYALDLRSTFRMWYFTRNLPGPRAYPIIGNVYDMINKPQGYIFELVDTYIRTYGKVFRYWIANQLVVAIADVKYIEPILRSTELVEKSDDYKSLVNWLNDGILFSKREKWIKRRKLYMPAFHLQSLGQYVEIFEKKSKILVRDLEKARLKDGEICLEEFLDRCTLSIVCETVTGVPFNSETDEDSQYVRAIKKVSAIVQKKIFDALYRFDIVYGFTKLAQEEKEALKVIHGFAEKIIKQRREEILNEQAKKPPTGSTGLKEEHDIGSKRQMNFLDILLQSNIEGKPLSNLDIREELDSFIFGGHDTVASALNFFFYNMALHPDYQENCFREIISVFGYDRATPVTNKDLNSFPFIEMCFKETLRMFPAVSLIGRKVSTDCEINGQRFAKGTNLGIVVSNILRSEELFPDPHTFKPERFNEAASSEKINPFAFIPFSMGPRKCVGQKYAMLEMKVIVANVLRNFHFEYAGDKNVPPALSPNVILRTKEPLKFKLKPRVY